MDMENSEKLGPVAESENFYDDLLEKAIATIPESGAVMVLGMAFVSAGSGPRVRVFYW